MLKRMTRPLDVRSIVLMSLDLNLVENEDNSEAKPSNLPVRSEIRAESDSVMWSECSFHRQ